MSSATASLRGGAPLPSEMKDLLNKLVAADEGTATCDALVGQMCETLEGVVLGVCPINSDCDFVAQANLVNWQHATTEGKYCSQPPTLEAELVEESTELQDPACKVLGPENGGCTPPSEPGLSCKAGYTCQGYVQNSSGQDPTLGECVPDSDANRAAEPQPSQSHAVRCHNDFYTQNHSCTTTAECSAEHINPRVDGLVCEARCVEGVCVAPTFEEEEEELAAQEDLAVN